MRSPVPPLKENPLSSQNGDFRYDSLTLHSSIEGTLFEMLEEHELFTPTKTYAQITDEEVAQ